VKLVEWGARPARARDLVAPVYLMDAALGLVLALLPYILTGLLSEVRYAAGQALWVFAIYAGFCIVRPTRRVSESRTRFELTEWALASGVRSRDSLARAYVFDLLWRSLYQVPATSIFFGYTWGFEQPADTSPVLPEAATFEILVWLFSVQLAARSSIAIWRHLGTATFVPARIRDLNTNAYPNFLSHCSRLITLALIVLVFYAARELIGLVGPPAGLAGLAALTCSLAWMMVRTSETVPHRPAPNVFTWRGRSREKLSRSTYSPRLGLWWFGAKRWVRWLSPLIPLSIVSALVARFAELPEGPNVETGTLGAFLLGGSLFAWLAGWSSPFRWSSRGRGADLLHTVGVAPGTLPRIELAARLFFASANVAPFVAVLPLGSLVPGAGSYQSARYVLALLFTVLLLRADRRPLTTDRPASARTLASLLLFLHGGAVLLVLVLQMARLELPLERLPYDGAAVALVLGAGALWVRSWFLASRPDRGAVSNVLPTGEGPS